MSLRLCLAIASIASLGAQSISAQTNWVVSPVNGHWYRLTTAQTWADAQAEAVSESANLATIRSADEQGWLVRQFGGGNAWIGLNDAATEGTFEWVSGETSTYRAFCAGEPNALTPEEDYVQLADWCSSPEGGWNDQAGTDVYPGLIERSTAPWVRSPVNNHWYRLSEPQTWADAEAQAQFEGGHLATIRSQAELDWLATQFSGRAVWTGLNDAAQEGSYVNSSGEPANFLPWCPGEPSASTADEDFVAINFACQNGGGIGDESAGATFPGLFERIDPAGAFAPFGDGCAGNAGVPRLDVDGPGLEPTIGFSFRIRVSNVPTSLLTVPVGLLGDSDSNWLGNQLPVDLTSIGMTGCSLYINILDNQFLSRAGRDNSTLWTVPIPNDPRVVGFNVLFQAFIVDPKSNPFEATMSNAGRATIRG